MEKQESTYITIGELAEKAGVSVRTLQYYDRIGLLRSTLSESGRRRYTMEDILTLQQIVFLKSFGFSLEEIKGKILKYESASDLGAVFAEQREALIGQAENLKNIIKMLDTVIFEIKKGNEISLSRIMMILQLMRQGNKYAFVLSYLGADQLRDIAERFKGPDSKVKSKGIVNSAEEILTGMKKLYANGADPAGTEGQKLAARWWSMVSDFTGDDEKLLKTLVSAGADIEDWPDETKDFRDVIENFLSAALVVYLKGKNIDLSKLGGKENE